MSKQASRQKETTAVLNLAIAANIASYQEACFHSPEEGALHISAGHHRLVDHVQVVAHSKALLQPVAPLQCTLLEQAQSSVVHRQHTM